MTRRPIRAMVRGDMPPNDGFTQLFRTALGHLNAGRTDAAAAACAALRQAAPHDPAVLQLQATIALRGGRPADALQLIRAGLRARPDHVPSLLIAARAAQAAGAPADAAAAARRAVALAPAQAPAQAEAAFLLCRLLLDLEDPALPAVIAETAARFPAQPAAWQDLGYALQRAGRADLALPALRTAVALAPDASGAWFALGLTCQDLADEAGAAAAFAAALDARGNFAEAAVNLGIAQQRLGDMAAALAAYRRAIRIRPDTFARIAQAVTSSATGMLWLDLAAFRRWLEA